MLKKPVLFIFLLIVLAGSTFAQLKKLERAEFKTDILDQWWSHSNPEIKQDCDMRLFVIKSTGIELNCINWADGFSGNKCTYDIAFTDNFFEIKPKVCQNDQNPGFIYGYLSESGLLMILLRKQQSAVSAALLSEKDWIKFEKVKR